VGVLSSGSSKKRTFHPPTQVDLVTSAWLGQSVPHVYAAADCRAASGVAPCVRHEDLCAVPEAAFRDLYQWAGLSWSEEVAAHLRSSNRPGTGYETNRLLPALSSAWQGRLTPQEARDIQAVLDGFGFEPGNSAP
jgi:hypothetical protein